MAEHLEHAQLEHVNQIAHTTDLLGQKPEAIAEEAQSLLNQWIVALNSQGLDLIADELERLNVFISDEDEGAVGDSLQNLTRLTLDAADTVEGPLTTHLNELAQALNRLERQSVERPDY
ncbi:MAG: hypothetical protein LH606_08995 [Cytophagaceae bacterium]|nr:hypothetical protein [Cytophagaceae bacterium]